VLLNPAILVVSGLSDVLGAIGQILLSYLVHMHSRLKSLGQGQVHVGPITWRFCHINDWWANILLWLSSQENERWELPLTREVHQRLVEKI
jgi:hypothetical protein